VVCGTERVLVARLLGWLGSNFVIARPFLFSSYPRPLNLPPPLTFLSLCPRPYNAVAEYSTTSA
jgi:hypothetical protein